MAEGVSREGLDRLTTGDGRLRMRERVFLFRRNRLAQQGSVLSRGWCRAHKAPKWIADQLHHAERISNKGKQDWKGTKNVNQRVRYIEEISQIKNLEGTVFFATYPDNQQEYWDYTVDALSMAIQRFGEDRRCFVRHQGFGYKTREKLKAALAVTGFDFEIQTGSEKRAEIRLADAICGYLGLTQFNADSKNVNAYPAMPSWFIDLKNKAPVMEG
jgi:hypothetical protein